MELPWIYSCISESLFQAPSYMKMIAVLFASVAHMKADINMTQSEPI